MTQWEIEQANQAVIQAFWSGVGAAIGGLLIGGALAMLCVWLGLIS